MTIKSESLFKLLNTSEILSHTVKYLITEELNNNPELKELSENLLKQFKDETHEGVHIIY